MAAIPTEQLFKGTKGTEAASVNQCDEFEKQIATVENWDRYVRTQSDRYAVNSYPTPNAIKFHGDTGHYSDGHYDSEKKQYVIEELGKSFTGIILAERYLARWKYKENAAYEIRTREFQSFSGEPIELLKINNADRSAEVEIKSFSDYAAFKANYAQPVPETDEVRYPHDLWVSLYVLTDGKVKRFRFAGKGRGAWFDFKKSVSAPTLVLTEFGTSEPQGMNAMDANGQQKTFYCPTFTSKGDIPEGMKHDVMRASAELNQLMRAWEVKRGAVPAIASGEARAIAAPASPVAPVEPVVAPTIVPADDFDYSSIPF